MGWQERYRSHIIVLLLGLIAVGGAVFWFHQTSLSNTTEIVISTPSPEIAVHVEGAVTNPGVYILHEGDRVESAVEAAGGFTSDAVRSSINLADPLRDGDLVRIYKVGEIPQKVNLNTAEAWLLEALPGIGEVLAQRIIEYRDDNGPFQHVDDLKKVEGIGAAAVDKLRDKVTVH
ncbi:MAG: ComEA family DNA-binding protein [Dehalococcoidia bacterium]|nr:MAG: ComEA family DNA-binding protein [Dehalococcoidia bacterium]